MGKIGGGSLLLAGIFLVFLGFLIQSDLLEALLNILGIIIIIVGAIMGVIGLISMFSGSKSGSSDY